MFFIIVVLKNCAIFTGKHLCWSLLLIKLHTLKGTATQIVYLLALSLPRTLRETLTEEDGTTSNNVTPLFTLPI